MEVGGIPVSQTPAGKPASSDASDPTAVFGANEWLVDEMYQRYLQDRNSVDPAWLDFFQDMAGDTTAPAVPSTTGRGGTATNHTTSEVTPAPGPPGHHPLPPANETSPALTGRVGQAGGDNPLDRRDAATDSIAAGAAQPEAKPSSSALVQHPVKRTLSGDVADEVTRLRGIAAKVVENMDASLDVPTATSVRSVPAKLLVDNRTVINNHLKRARGGKISFTHLIGFALIEALKVMPEMNSIYTQENGKPAVMRPGATNLGIAIDLAKPDGSRQLMVPAIKDCQDMDFAHFWAAYEDVVRRARDGKLSLADFQGTTISLTNVGTIGTVHSVPRLMQGQGAIIGVGAMNYPAEYQGASNETLARLAVSKVMTLTSTYDHRIIQGAQSGDFLRLVHEKLLGQDGFYDRVFESLKVPYEPIRWVQDIAVSNDEQINKTARVVELIHAYRVRGHLMANTDPLVDRQRSHPDLDVQTHGLTLWDLDREFPTGGFGGKPRMTLRSILGVLRDSYCRTVGVEYMHIQDPDQRNWMQQRLERPYAKPDREDQLRILRSLNGAEAFETFLQTKFVGQKRFSLEGGESVIPLLDQLLSDAADAGLEEVCIGMPHRGRLNVLANIAGKSYGQIFREFEGTHDPRSVQGSGDVKYHLGTEGEFVAESGATTQVYLAANPSHLEAVNPVLEGIVRAKQDRLNLGGESFPVMPVLLHGDAAFAGQGVVAETLNLSQLRGYRTGGTVHIVINNQVGFTTAPDHSRSSVYCTDVGKMIQAPIFHVNGDDPEACARVARMAFEFRQEFDSDVIIDMVCYRRRGHNEGDDPSMTQPLMYSVITNKRSVRKLYTESLIGRGDITQDEAEGALRDYQERLERVFAETRASQEADGTGQLPTGLEKPLSQRDDGEVHEAHNTGIAPEVVKAISNAHVNPPVGFEPHPKLRQTMQKRAKMGSEGKVDWAYGEILAFGSLLVEGVPVRLSGQDSRRGTFVQRHAVLIDRTTAEEWTPLLYLGKGQAPFWVHDSLLSEYAAMGFEYGYSVERPDALVLWEAQFGDFANGAQTVVDEFISSGEQKWGQRSSVVLLLPHGYDGQGPDHSSARMERFLTICAENNMTVAQPSTPASYFHLLRHQAYARPRRPLVVFTPKSMLRHKDAVSAVGDFTSGSFSPVIADAAPAPEKVDRVLLCSGKIYWDLLNQRKKLNDEKTAIVRLEQIYPLDVEGVAEAIAPYGDADLAWVQDEPRNQGPWPFIALNLPEAINRHIRVVCRAASASPATGSAKKHAIEQKELIDRAFSR